ncbi:hypothetical protein PVNG_05449 [Plasmodium vivax North Korean]|uniref:PIR Superfamily Protein n=1 Tax=Plasmodium vivax North Korean TaxID=1035514 RepID=A0A0J9TM76_PLAVI|nr:hypothetical protein PVNG_05449 [Plasmodium vivax North Korean]
MNLYLKPFSYISSAFGKIELIWNDFIEKKLKHRKNETCEPIHSIIMDNDWRDRKELYEYYVNYDALSDTVKIFTNMCEEFFQYVESKKKLYEHFKEPCLSKDTNMCPKFYDECKKYDPENVLSNHSCHEYIMKERAAAASSVLQRVNTPSDSDPNSDDRDGRMMTYDAPKLSGNPHTDILHCVSIEHKLIYKKDQDKTNIIRFKYMFNKIKLNITIKYISFIK